ncbi:hypothetical protein J2X83_001069 [Brevibacillus nitrificans]|nr:hypothetical protein [Brevibacillus nitrificans]
MRIYEMTIQFRVADMERGQRWYQMLLQREPGFIPHEGFAEWELIPGCWLQVAEGEQATGCGPLRLGVESLEVERERVIHELQVEWFEIYQREEVPVKWATFADPWGNRIGFFEYHEDFEKVERLAKFASR